MPGQFYERNAWILLLLIELWLIVEGVLIIGGVWEGPELGTVDFDLVVGYIGFGLLAAAITLTGYRRGHRWAWIALWVLPLAFGAITVNHLLGEEFCATCAANAVASLLGLIVPYRVFFRRT